MPGGNGERAVQALETPEGRELSRGEDGGGKMVESVTTQRMFPKRTARLPAAAAKDFGLTHTDGPALSPLWAPQAQRGVSHEGRWPPRILRAQADALKHPGDICHTFFPARTARREAAPCEALAISWVILGTESEKSMPPLQHLLL